MEKIKVSEASGLVLDYLVAVCEGGTDFAFDGIAWGFKLRGKLMVMSKGWAPTMTFCPSTDWATGGPIIDREDIAISPLPDGLWNAYAPNGTKWVPRGELGLEVYNWTHKQQGYSPLIAAMRCYVASTLGDEVEISEELLK